MTTERTAAEIKSRFDSEQDYILQYVDFLQIRSEIHDPVIFELNRTLIGHRLSKIETRPYERLKEPYSQEEIAALVTSIEKVTPHVRQALRDYEREKAGWLPLLTPKGTSFHHQDLLGEWVNYLMTQFSVEPTPEEIEAVRQRSLRQAMEQTDRDEEVTEAIAGSPRP